MRRRTATAPQVLLEGWQGRPRGSGHHQRTPGEVRRTRDRPVQHPGCVRGATDFVPRKPVGSRQEVRWNGQVGGGVQQTPGIPIRGITKTMNELLSDNLWTTIKHLAKKSPSKRAAVAYVTSEEFVKFGDGDVLITDASDHAVSAGHTKAELLAKAFKRGAKLYSLPGLHAKVLLLGGTAVIGSANLSETSANDLVEAAWVTDTPAAVGMATSFIQQLVTQSNEIDKKFLDRILKIRVKINPIPGGKSARPRKVKIPKHRTWIVGVHELVNDFPAEHEAIDRGITTAEEKVTRSSSAVSWIRWTGNFRFRIEAKEGDTVIQIWSRNGAKKPSAVYRHAPILLRQDEDICTRFFVEDFKDCDEASITWGEFKKLIQQVGLSGKIGPTSARPISEAYANALFALWGE